MFEIKNKQFAGPLHLLLELIEKQKLDITSVSLVDVADDYLEYVESKEQVDLANLSEFLLIASQLILLKSKALLPLFEFTKEEEEEIENLEERLKEYQKFKRSSEELGKILADKNYCFSKDEEKIQRISFVCEKVNPEDLHKIFISTLQNLPTKEELTKKFIEEVVSIEEKITELKNSLEGRMKVAFHEMIEQSADKIEIVVTFLAMLEMVKQRLVSVKQSELFGDISITSNQNSKK